MTPIVWSPGLTRSRLTPRSSEARGPAEMEKATSARSQQVLRAVLVALVELPGPAEDLPGERVAAVLEVGLHLDLAPVAGLVGQAQDVEGLRDPPTSLGVAVWREACGGNFMQLSAGVGSRIVCNSCGATRRLCRVADHD